MAREEKVRGGINDALNYIVFLTAKLNRFLSSSGASRSRQLSPPLQQSSSVGDATVKVFIYACVIKIYLLWSNLEYIVSGYCVNILFL